MSLPQPYYQDDSCTLYNADCRDILPHIPKVDLVLTDPPYNIGVKYDGKSDSGIGAEVAPLLIAIANVCSITTGIPQMVKYPNPDWVLCWRYSGGANYSCWGFNCWQPILVYGKDPYLRDGLGCRSDVIDDNVPSSPMLKRHHPCPKPLTFVKKWLTRCSTKPSDLILDPFAGSGTTGVAAKQLGRKSILIELSERYCSIAATRLTQEQLF